jgi:glycosyltransferase involved in cell wall biosynthesis
MNVSGLATSTESAGPLKEADSRAGAWPRISIVTPVYNGKRYLEETIRSILDQGYPNLEYIIVNDGSTDGTVDIITKYEQYLACWVNQPNKGLYAALNAGFARSSGEIMGWINANDKLHTSGLFVVGEVFNKFPEVEWITGRPTVFNEQGLTVKIQDLPHWSRRRFLAGANRHIQQESTYWRRSLWEKAGGYLDTKYRAEGDFELWIRFFRQAQLYSVDALIGGWRFHADSLSHGKLDKYNETCDQIVQAELRRAGRSKLAAFAALLERMDGVIRRIPKVRIAWRFLVMERFHHFLYRRPGADWPPTIEYREDHWCFRPK